jgi:hypothetical protein
MLHSRTLNEHITYDINMVQSPDLDKRYKEYEHELNMAVLENYEV